MLGFAMGMNPELLNKNENPESQDSKENKEAKDTPELDPTAEALQGRKERIDKAGTDMQLAKAKIAETDTGVAKMKDQLAHEKKIKGIDEKMNLGKDATGVGIFLPDTQTEVSQNTVQSQQKTEKTVETTTKEAERKTAVGQEAVENQKKPV